MRDLLMSILYSYKYHGIRLFSPCRGVDFRFVCNI
nr:MAG TPA: hypothetical protein [Caudoviricetes sp.]